MDEVLVEPEPMDPEDPPRRGVDPDDVVAPVDDDDADREVEKKTFRARRQVRRDPCVALGGPDRGVQGKVGRCVAAGEAGCATAEAGSTPATRRKIRIRPGSSRYGPGSGADGLGRTKDQVSAFTERVGERLERRALHRDGEIDEDVPAQDEIDPREWRPPAEIVLTEDDRRPERLADLVPVVGLARSSGHGSPVGTFWIAVSA